MLPASERQIFLIDAIGPFFRGYDRTRINWSKIPWEHLSTPGPQRRAQFDRIREDMERFCSEIAAVGFNAVSLDDVSHLARHEWYEPEVAEQIDAFREEFAEIFKIIRRHGLDIYLTMDVMTFTPALKERLGSSPRHSVVFLQELLDRFFRDFPEITGLILRIGESDGIDVKGSFRSELHLKSAKMLNRFLKELLPVFEKHERLCVFRTWTVGAHRIGDLIWRPDTLTRTVEDISSPAFVLSMKYGESDFFRYLPLNKCFFRTNVPKIVELQTRREYEGCGEYPSFVGWDYAHFARELRHARNLIGISVWCQTGGWLPFRRLAYLEDGAIWTEINTFVTLKVFRENLSVEEAIRQYPGCNDPSAWLELLRLSDEVVKELLYTPEFARHDLYFRRVRIPPLIAVYWHNIFISHSLRRVFHKFVVDPEECLLAGQAALENIERMKHLAERCGLPVEDIDFMYETFRILLLARTYFLTQPDEELEKEIRDAKKAYKKKFPKKERMRYAIKLDFQPFHFSPRYAMWLFNVLVREHRGYRVIDRILGIHLLAFGYWFLKKTRPKMIPKFARKSAMGIDAIFR